MNITVTSQNREEYLYVESVGEINSADELTEHANLIYAEFLKYNPKKILIYEMETDFPPGLSAYLNLVNHYMDNFVPEVRSVKVAVVLDEKYKDIGDFWKTVCINRGFQYHTFGDFRSAEEWLVSDKHSNV